jgi:hypothetical protein
MFPYLSFFILLTSIYPYIGLPSVFPSDVQPTNFLLCLLYISMRPVKVFALVRARLFLSSLLLSLLLVALFVCVLSHDLSIENSLRGLFPYLNIVVIVSVYRCIVIRSDIDRLIRYVILTTLLIHFFGILCNVFGIPLPQYLVQRSINEVDSSFLLAERGWPSFTPEPSRIPDVVAYCGLLLYLTNSASTIYPYIGLLLVALLARSGQLFVVISELIISFSVVLLFRMLATAAKSTLANIRIALSPILNIFIGLSIATPLLFFLSIGSRGFSALQSFASIADDTGIVIKISGIPMTIASIATMFTEPYFSLSNPRPFMRPEFLEAYENFFTLMGMPGGGYLTRFQDNVYSVLGAPIILFGFVGFIIVILLVFYLINSHIDLLRSRLYPLSFKFTMTFLLVTFFLFSTIKTPISNPTIWLLFCFILEYRYSFPKVTRKPSDLFFPVGRVYQ